MKKFVLILAGSCLGFVAPAALFTSDTTIAPNNTNYDGDDIVVIGCAVTIDGPHTFSDVVLVENAVITHSPATNSTNVGLNLTISNNVIIEAGSAIVADGLGYRPGSGPGAGTNATDTLPFGLVYTNGGGGGYGGNGGSGIGGAPGGTTYGSLLNPTNAGSGGGEGFGPGGAGGGIVRLNIGGALVVDGQITANGGPGIDPASGGGSGGGIFIAAPSASGTGTISANGGDGEPSEGGGGGGGRVTLSITANDFSGAVAAQGGSGAFAGGAGTVYIRATEVGESMVLIDNGGLSGANTPVTPPSLVNLTIRGGAVAYFGGANLAISLASIVIESNSWLTAPQQQILRLQANSITVQAGGGFNFSSTAASDTGEGQTEMVDEIVYGGGGGHGGSGGSGFGALGGAVFDSVTAPNDPGGKGGGFGNGGGGGNALALSVTQKVTVDGVMSADGGSGSAENSGGGAGGSVSLKVPVLTGSGAISANGGNPGSANGGGGGGGRIALILATNEFSGTISAHGGLGYENGGAGTIYIATNGSQTGLLLLDNGGLTGAQTPLVAMPEQGDLILRNAATGLLLLNPMVETLYIASNSFLVCSNIESIFAQSLVIESNAGLFVAAVSTQEPLVQTGGTLDSQGITTGGGGGNMGFGGASAFGAPGGAAGFEGPQDQPGGSGGARGGAGGRGISLTVATSALVNGRISADGEPGIATGSGGGAGGGVSLIVQTLAGNGTISANGGPGQLPWGGGGGGGIVGITCKSNNLFTGELTAYGGGGATGGGAGVVTVRTNGPLAQVVIDNNGLSGANTGLSAEGLAEFDLSILHGASAIISGFPSDLSRNMLIGSNSFLTVLTNTQYAMNLDFENVTIQATGGINYDGKGSSPTEGQDPGGAGGGNGGIGGHGAIGGIESVPINSPVTEPDSPGQGGQYIPPGPPVGGYGGGVMTLRINELLSLEGKISADGLDGLSGGCGGGAGGSIWIITGRLSGNGSITANGGAGNLPYAGGGGGGRIAIHATTNNFTGVISALGGAGFNPGGAGTIYMVGANTPGTVIVDNGGASNGYTLFPQLSGANVILQGGAVVKAPAAVNGLPGSVSANTLLIQSNSFIVGTSNQPLSIQVSNKLTIAAGGGIICDGVSDTVGQTDGGSAYPANGNRTGGGGANAGNGGAGLDGAAGGKAVSDSVTEPKTPGGPGGPGLEGEFPPALGGGFVTLMVAGTLEVDGVLSANGAASTNGWGGGGAGGSIHVSAISLTGTGTISANGGSGSPPNGGGGGGGRIAIGILSDSFTGPISASGGSGYSAGGAGIVCISVIDSTPKLIVDNNNLTGGVTPFFSVPLSSVDLTVANGAILEPQNSWLLKDLVIESNASISLPAVQSVLTVSGNAQVLATGAITANGGGWDSGTGPGAGTTASNYTSSGGGYGGAGGASQGGALGGETNGSPEMPTAWGSGGGALFGKVVGVSQGGGAIALNIGGTLTVQGVISANGNDAIYPGAGGGAGGSVWLTAGTLTGNGLIAANGGLGQGNLGGGGGGGRIAFYSPSNEFAGQITASGGSGFAAGGDGSIYFSTNTTTALITATLLPGLAITQPAAPNQVTLAWPGFAGASYQVQSSTDLIHWQAFGGPISGNAGAMNVTLTPSPGGQQQYFRLVIVN